MQASNPLTAHRRVVMVAAVCTLIACALGPARGAASDQATASGASTVRLVTLGIPVGLMGREFWVYADGRLVGSDQTLRVLHPAEASKFVIVQYPGGLEIHDYAGKRVSFLTPCSRSLCGDRAGSWTLAGRFADSRPAFIETVAVFVPGDMRRLQVAYRARSGLVGSSPYWLTTNMMPIPEGFGDDILFLPPRSWAPTAATAAVAAVSAFAADSTDCFIDFRQRGATASPDDGSRLDISEFSRQFLWYNADPLVQALRATGGQPQFRQSTFGIRVTRLTIAASRVPERAPGSDAANLAATTLAGTREYDARELAALAGAAAEAGPYFADLPGRLEQCEQQYPQYAQVYAHMLQLTQRIVAEVAEFQSLAQGPH